MKNMEKKTAYRITASFEDFDGDLQKWKDTFYELWRVQLTWEPAYNITLIDRRCHSDHGWAVNLDVLVKESFKKQTLEWMEQHGYRNLYVCEQTVGLVSAYDEGIEDIDYLDIEW